MQDCLNCRKPNNCERYIYVGNDKNVEIKAIRKFILLLQTEFYLDLNEIFIVPSFRRNLIFTSALEKSDYSCSFGNGKFSLFHDSKLVSLGTLSGNDNLCILDTIASFNKSLQFSTRDLKRKLIIENLAVLWHRRLGYIFRRRIEGRVTKEILNPLDFTDFDICVSHIEGKQINKRRF